MVDVYLGNNQEPRLDELANIYNPLEEDFTWQIAGIDYTIPAKSTKILPLWSCRVIAKHLADKILQEKYNVPDTNTDTPIRRKVLSEILVEEAKEKGITVSEEEAQKSLDSELQRASNLAQSEKDPHHVKKAKKVKITPPTA